MRIGQHFLHDPGVIARIAAAVAPPPGAALVEIGPGRGALTRALLAQHARLAVIEIDRDLVARLQGELGPHAGLSIHTADALSFDFRSVGTDLYVVGNLPYNISTPLLFQLLGQADCIREMVFMLQKEVVERLCAAPDSGDYGRLGVMVQARCVVTRLFDVGPGAFQPPPRVDSAVVRITPRGELAAAIRHPARFTDLVRRAFGQRRKMLRNALRGIVADPGLVLADLKLDGSARPETLTVAQFVALANLLGDRRAGSATGSG
jgi:16S rRNA (adenine1518-N6/adenine1519-N6)-dimethyltransferase